MKEIVQLPLWAQIAFGARCARRAQFMVATRFPNSKSVGLLDEVAACVEAIAACPPEGYGDKTGMDRAGKKWEQAACLLYEEANIEAANAGVADAVKEADRAINVFRHVVATGQFIGIFQHKKKRFEKREVEGFDFHHDMAKREGFISQHIADAVFFFSSTEFADAVADDFAHLDRLARLENWTSHTPVAPHVFSSLSPMGRSGEAHL